MQSRASCRRSLCQSRRDVRQKTSDVSVLIVVAAGILALMPFGNSKAESQRDSGSKPRVARNELPWETGPQANNPNGVVSGPWKRGATPLGLKTHPAAAQGSSFLATLGWTTQSLWDCRTTDFSSASFASCAAQNFRKAFGLKVEHQRAGNPGKAGMRPGDFFWRFFPCMRRRFGFS